MDIAIRPRSPALAPFVESLGYYEGVLPSRRERSLPTGRMGLLVNLREDEFRTYDSPVGGTVHRVRGTMLAGPRSRHTVIDTDEQRCIVAVNFWAGGAAPFFIHPPSETLDSMVELDRLWGRDGAVLRERLLEASTPEARLMELEAAMLEHLPREAERDPAVAFAAAAFERGFPVSDVTARLGFLPKRFLERFRGQVGLAPKRYSRLRRLQRLLRGVNGRNDVDWCEAAVEHGFSDQAHLIHDFRELTGITPTAYQPRSREARNHVPVEAD